MGWRWENREESDCGEMWWDLTLRHQRDQNFRLEGRLVCAAAAERRCMDALHKLDTLHCCSRQRPVNTQGRTANACSVLLASWNCCLIASHTTTRPRNTQGRTRAYLPSMDSKMLKTSALNCLFVACLQWTLSFVKVNESVLKVLKVLTTDVV